MSDADQPVQSLQVVIREWTHAEGTRVRFRKRDADANRGGRITITATPGRWDVPPKAIAVIRDATTKNGHLTLTLDIVSGSLTVEEAKLLTEPEEGAGCGLTRLRHDVKTIREVYPLPGTPAVPALPASTGPICTADCPHHNHPNGPAHSGPRRTPTTGGPI